MRFDSVNIDVSEFKNTSGKHSQKNEQDEVAIIGMAIRTAGADNVDEFWNNIRSGKDSTGDIPVERKKWCESYLGSIGFKKENMVFPKSAYMQNIDLFDYEFFDILPKEAELMDPNQRIFLETAWEAIEDAGYGGNKLSNSRTGVYVGYGDDSDYYDMISKIDNDFIDIARTGNLRPVIASRLAYILDLKGPNMLIDTSCSSSLVAIHIASEALKNKECDIALAGGIKISVLPNKNNSNIGVESKSGRTKTFDDDADGTMWGEGIGVLVLKPLRQAICDRDAIYAVIKGSSVNQDGKSAGLSAPNQSAQEELLCTAWENSGINPVDLNYIEAHGTGTHLGDPIEIKTIKKALENFTSRKQFCAVGSTKPNVGHTVHASGVISMIKVLLMIHYRTIPPLANFNVSNNSINFEDSPVYINDRSSFLIEQNHPITCGISSFGVSGTNAHIVVQSVADCVEKVKESSRAHIITFSAKNEESLTKLLDKYVRQFKEIKQHRIEAVCYTANTGRSHYRYRIAIVFKNYTDLLHKLNNLELSDVYSGDCKDVNSNEKIDVSCLEKIDQYTYLKQIASKYVAGAEINWSEVYHDEKYEMVHLPSYPFQKTRCWIKVPESKYIKGIRDLPLENTFIDGTILKGRNNGQYTDSEKKIATILENVMGFHEISVNANLSEMGGDSIILTKLNSKINKEMNVNITISDIFSNPSIEKLGRIIDKQIKQSVALEYINYADSLSEDIAIIGISARMPNARNADEFWENIVSGKECISVLSEERRKDCNDYLKFKGQYDKSVKYAKAGYISGISDFDWKFFNISPKEASVMDPHQRLFLQEAWKAIEDAGYSQNDISGTKTGVFVGYTGDFRFNYWQIVNSTYNNDFKIAAVPNLAAIIPSRISYLLDLKGPSMLVDTACSSSLTAVHLACRSIKSGECDMAIAGGVRVDILPLYDEERNIGIESPSFRIRAFDDAADGTVWGEGVAAFILKPYDKAKKDHDHIYALIKGSAINQDGYSMGITAPNPEAQSTLLKEAWSNAGINPETISYIECHGTGTRLGDPMEITGISNAFIGSTNKKQFCGIGSVKSNIGHLDAASGLASLLKCTQALQKQEIPASINFEKSNNEVIFEDSPVYLVDKTIPWLATEYPRRCGISSFGFSGTNCHIVLEEAPTFESHGKDELNLFVLSAKSKESLYSLLFEYNKFFKIYKDVNISDLCYTLCCGRNHYKYRLAFVMRNINELRQVMGSLLDRQTFETRLTDSFDTSVPSEEVIHCLNEYLLSGRKDINLLKILGRYYQNGADVDWKKLYGLHDYYRIPAPAYAFEKNKCWVKIPEKRKYFDCVENVKNLLALGDLSNELTIELEKALDNIINNGEEKVIIEPPTVILTGHEDSQYTEIEKILASIWCDVLGLQKIDIKDNFYELGGHSIAMMQIISEIEKQLNFKIGYNDFNNQNTIESLALALDGREKEANSSTYPVLTCDKVAIHDSFPLTDIQMSYMLGRKNSFEMGGVCTHIYMEIESELDIERLNTSLNKVIERHPMLRAVIENDGTQHFLSEKVSFHISVKDITSMSLQEQEQLIISERERISHHVFKNDTWPLMGVTALKIAEGKHYLFVDFDMLIADGSSLQIIGKDWIEYYKNLDAQLPEIEITFRDYIFALTKLKRSELYDKDKDYWLKRLETFPQAPKLLYKNDPSEIETPHFSRLTKIFEKSEWLMLKEISKELNVTPSSLLCGAFSEVLAYWSNQPKFAVNFTVFNRYPFHKDVDNIIGDFTSVMLVEIDMESDDSFPGRVQKIQSEIYSALEHRHYDGVELIRKIAARDNRIGEPVMPIVFTSMLFNSENDPWSELGRTVMGLSQTPQVYLDHQAGEIGGCLVINWDYVNEIFEKSVIDQMFSQYIDILNYLVTLKKGE